MARSIDPAKMREHEDRVLDVVSKLSRLEKLIMLRYLRTLLGVAIDETAREIQQEYWKEHE